MSGISNSQPLFSQRTSGVLLHPTALPSPHGIGDLGSEAIKFVDFLKKSGQSWWQMCPLGPMGFGNSPYHTLSAFAGNPLFISLDLLVQKGLLSQKECEPSQSFSSSKVEYQSVSRFKGGCLEKAFHRFEKKGSKQSKQAFRKFCGDNKEWLISYSQYNAIKDYFHGKPWWEWDVQIAKRKPQPLKKLLKKCSGRVVYHQFLQYLFHQQWDALHRYAKEKGVGLIGDVPIFVSLDSADVWVHREIFNLDDQGRPREIAGVPPDYFSKTGQLWGNPVYKWDVLKKKGYKWWFQRLEKVLSQFDAVRLDHFIGFTRYWAVPQGAIDARLGRWKKGPGPDFFKRFLRIHSQPQVIAEDLGSLTPEVEAMRDRFQFPGMKVLQFAFDTHEGAKVNRSYNFSKRCVVYTGTHDNDTTVGWFRSLSDQPERREWVLRYLGGTESSIHWNMIHLAMKTSANTVIVPIQDILGLGSEARLNTPATDEGNWEWRLAPDALTENLAEKLHSLTHTYERLNIR